MPRKCAAFGCRGNYAGEPYSKLVSFPNDKNEREKWINAMPNERTSLTSKKEIWICASHFDCAWVTVKGGKRPSQPPSVFPGVPKSCLKQVQESKRPTQKSAADIRQLNQQQAINEKDKIISFENFLQNISLIAISFYSIKKENEVSLFSIGDGGRCVTMFLKFRKTDSKFGFLQLIDAEKDGIEVKKSIFNLQKNNLLHKWSQFKNIISVLSSYVHKSQDVIDQVIDELSAISEFEHHPSFQFIQEQLQILSTPANGRRYTKNVLIFAAELLCTSPAAYRLLRNSNVILLPHETLVRDLMNKSLQDGKLKSLFERLLPEQRLVNLLFDEVKLKRALRFSGGHIVGHATNSEELATSALVIEMICHHGGPRLVVRIIPVACLSAEQLKDVLLEAALLVANHGGNLVSFICDNCPLNQGAYKLLGGPGKVVLHPYENEVFLVYDYVHIFKNIRNNWITESSKELLFTKEGNEYLACWSDIVRLYNIDKQNAVRLTKLTYSSVYPKPLQRQSVQLVFQVFNEKTVAALKTFQKELNINDGTIVFISLISQWFTMMNVKDKYACVRLRDNLRSPWTLDNDNFILLHELCETITSCRWQGGRIRQRKLTRFTANAFVVTTVNNINAAECLLEKHKFKYVLPSVFSQDPLEKFFGQARQRFGGNFYIDVNDVIVAGKVQRLHQLVKHDVIVKKDDTVISQCSCCDEELCESDIDSVDNFQIVYSEQLLASSDALKHKVVYIAGYLVHKYGLGEESEEDSVSNKFVEELDRGGLSVPTLGIVFFVHCAINVHEKLTAPRKHCGNYVAKLFSLIDSPMAQNKKACHSLKNILFKAYASHNNEREREVGCLRRQEKLSN